MGGMLYVTVFITMLGCGLMAGLFFAFSISVMNGLARRPPAEGMAAMQAINVAIVNPVFLVVFLGTPLACLLVAVLALLQWPDPGSLTLLAGSLTYIAGGFLVTMFINVPMNNRLMALSASSPESADYWKDYLRRWTAWNHLRTIASLAALGLLAAAI